MRKAAYLAVFLILIAAVGFAAEKKEQAASPSPETKPDTVFQKVGDFMTGEYDVNGKPLKKAGVFQVMADEVNKIEPAPVR